MIVREMDRPQLAQGMLCVGCILAMDHCCMIHLSAQKPRPEELQLMLPDRGQCFGSPSAAAGSGALAGQVTCLGVELSMSGLASSTVGPFQARPQENIMAKAWGNAQQSWADSVDEEVGWQRCRGKAGEDADPAALDPR